MTIAEQRLPAKISRTKQFNGLDYEFVGFVTNSIILGHIIECLQHKDISNFRTVKKQGGWIIYGKPKIYGNN